MNDSSKERTPPSQLVRSNRLTSQTFSCLCLPPMGLTKNLESLQSRRSTGPGLCSPSLNGGSLTLLGVLLLRLLGKTGVQPLWIGSISNCSTLGHPEKQQDCTFWFRSEGSHFFLYHSLDTAASITEPNMQTGGSQESVTEQLGDQLLQSHLTPAQTASYLRPERESW